MAIPTKRYFYDRTILGLQDAYPNIDWKIQPREVFLVIDDIVNAMAKENYFENWKLTGANTDEAYITTWADDAALTVTDVTDQPSYLTFPSIYAALPMNNGIVEIWPLNYEYGSVKIRRHEDIRRTRHLMSGNMQGQLGGFPRGILFVFDQVDVGKNYGTSFGMRLVIKDSSAISETAPFPVAADKAEEIIKRAIEFFTNKRVKPTDVIRDRNDAVVRN